MSQFTDTQPPMLSMVLSAGLIALLVSYAVDAEPFNAQAAQQPAVATSAASAASMPFEPPTLAPSAIVIGSLPSYRMEEGMLKLYFGPNKVDIPPNATDALEDVVKAIRNGQHVQISGFHDETGNAQQNILLSKKRAEVVQKKLIAMGAPAKAIEVKKPAVAVTTSDHAQARRVEVTLLN